MTPPGVKNDPISNKEDKKEEFPLTPKGETDGFDEIWKACWSRGGKSQPKQPALKAYTAAIRRGAKHADILEGVRKRRGVDKPDTEYAPQLVTWLNQDRWADVAPAEIKALSKKLKRPRRGLTVPSANG
jgi:hypothetical protein